MLDLREQRDVSGEDTDFTVHRRDDDGVDGVGINPGLGCDDFEREGHGGLLLRGGDDFVDATLHVEIAFWNVVEFAIEDHLEAAHGFFDGDVFAGRAREHFGDRERLREEALDFAGAVNGLFILGREFVEAENGDDVLEILVALEDALEFAGDAVVLFADDRNFERLRDGGERVHSGINTELGDGALQHDGGVQVREGVGGRGVGQIVGRHVDRLHGGDGAFLRRRDALLEEAHFVGERGLVTDGGRRAAEERGHFGAGLGETENIVDEEQHVLVFLVAEILGHRERREGDAHTRAWGLVHLAVHERDLGLHEVFLVDDAGFGHFVVKIVTFARAFADAGEYGEAAVGFGDVVNEFENDDGLTDAGATEGSGFTTLDEGRDEIDDLDAGLEDRGFGVLIGERGGGTVNGIFLLVLHGAAAVYGRARDVKNAAKNAVADGHGNRSAGIDYFHTTLQAFGGGHGDGAREAATEMLLHFEREILGFAADGERDGERLVDGRDGVLRELHVDHGADDLDDFAGIH